MKKYVKLLVIITVLFHNYLNAQIYRPLSIGDKIPDLTFQTMLNHSSASGKLSDFKDKAILIDMWFAGCAPCISAMPKMDSLQNEFKSEGLQVLLVNVIDKKADIEYLFNNHRELKKIKLTQIVEDSLIKSIFPAVSYPTQIWINKKGIVVGITDGNESSRENIRKLVRGEKLNLPLKVDELDGNIRWAIAPQISIRYGENLSNLLHYSYFSKARGEFNGGVSPSLDEVNGIYRWNFRNNTLIQLYNYAYAGTTNTALPNILNGAPDRVIRLDHKPLSSIRDKENKSNVFCYDLMYKYPEGPSLRVDTVHTRLQKFMIADLDRFFGLKSHEEVRDIECYVISPNGKGKRYLKDLDSSLKSFAYNGSLKKGKKLSFNKVVWRNIVRSITEYSDRPFIFEVDGSRLNFEVTWNPENIDQMNAELEKYDLKFEKTIRKRKVIVLEDAD